MTVSSATDQARLPNDRTEPHRDAAPLGFALTAPQMAIWLDQALHAGKPIYNTGQVLTIRTALDIDRFAVALRRTVSDHDALRLRFVQRGPLILQHVDESVPALEYRDFSAESNPGAAADVWIDELFWRPIKPVDFPLCSFALGKVNSTHFVWLQKYHHLIIDATGRQRVARSLAANYDALTAGAEPPASVGGSIFSARTMEDGYINSTDYESDAAYWRKRFENLPTQLVQRESKFSEKARSGRPVRIAFDLTLAQSDALRDVARRQTSSVFKILLAVAWCCFSRLYGTEDLVFGVPLASRPDSSSKNTVGLFAKVMPFRVSLERGMTFGGALEKIGEDLALDFAHQKFPTDHINGLLQLRRIHRGGLYDIAVNYVRNDYTFKLGGVPIECRNMSAGFAVPWSLMALEYDPGAPIQVLLDYDPGRVGPEEVAEFRDSFNALLLLVTAPQLSDSTLGMVLAGAGGARVGTEPPVTPEKTLPDIPEQERRRPLDEVETAVADIWQRCLGREVTSVSNDFFELGGDSLKAVLVIGECSERFGFDVPLSILFERRTVAGLADAIREAGRNDTFQSLVQLKEGNGSAPLLLVHPVGGTVFCYRDLAMCLPAAWPVYGMQASGLRQSEALPDSIAGMADEYLHAAAELIAAGPVRLGGWSFGGLVAFEMARRLIVEGRPALSLTLIDTPARPEFRQEDTALSACAAALGIDIMEIQGAVTAGSIASAVASQVGRSVISEAQVERMVAVVRNARRLRQRYDMRPVAGRVLLLRAAAEPGTSDAEFDWSGLVRGKLDIVSIPATHNSIVRPPHVERVAAAIAAIAAEVPESLA